MKIRNASVCSLAILLSTHPIGGCVPEDDSTMTGPPNAAPVIVRGAYSYVLTYSAENGTIDVRDSVRWYPELAYLSITVANHSAGSGTLEITGPTGTRISLDSVNSDTEILNRRISSAMPLRLRLALEGFTGALSCGLQLGAVEINGMVARLTLRDSLGLERSLFRQGERIDFSFSLANLTGDPRQWAKGDGRPMCRFTISGGGSLLRDSFEGFAWPASPEVGILQAGDSIRVLWPGVLPHAPLAPGHYLAVADPQFVFTELGVLRGLESPFEVGP